MFCGGTCNSPWSIFLSRFSCARQRIVWSLGTRGTTVTDGLTRLSGTGTSWLAAGRGSGSGAGVGGQCMDCVIIDGQCTDWVIIGGQCTDWVIIGGQCMDWLSSASSSSVSWEVQESSRVGSKLRVISSFMLSLLGLPRPPSHQYK